MSTCACWVCFDRSRSILKKCNSSDMLAIQKASSWGEFLYLFTVSRIKKLICELQTWSDRVISYRHVQISNKKRIMLLLLFGTKQQQCLPMKRKCLHIMLYYSVNPGFHYLVSYMVSESKEWEWYTLIVWMCGNVKTCTSTSSHLPIIILTLLQNIRSLWKCSSRGIPGCTLSTLYLAARYNE